uniref:Serpentine receptor class gamma n=1 Tax=Schistosoma mansoni TaxID=6183 RepID=A0A3Q0KPB2_SCHMA
MLICRRKIKPVWFSKTAFVIAVLGLPPVYITSVHYEHVNGLFPFVSSFGVFSPEKHWFRVLMISYALFNMAGNCFWFMIARSKIVNMTQSLIPHIINSSIRLLMIISGLCLIGLSIFDMENYNETHYLMTVGNFTCHVLSILFGCCLVAKYFEKPFWFSCFRLMLIVKMVIGAMSFVYFNVIGLPLLSTLNIYRMKPTDGGYWEFLYCAIAEWVLVLACILFTLAIALETQTYEDILVRSKTRNITTIQLMKQV